MREQIPAHALGAGAILDPRLGRREHTRGEINDVVAAEAGEAPRLEYAHEQSLRGGREILDLVNEQRAVTGFLENAQPGRAAGILLAEQAGLGIGLTQTAGDEVEEWPSRPWPALMQIARERFAP